MKITRTELRSIILKEVSDDILNLSPKNIPGGMSEKLKSMSFRDALKEIARVHNMSIEDIMMEFDVGCKVEMEHTDSILIACEIALDHLVEEGDYYTRLSGTGL